LERPYEPKLIKWRVWELLVKKQSGLVFFKDHDTKKGTEESQSLEPESGRDEQGGRALGLTGWGKGKDRGKARQKLRKEAQKDV